MGYELLFLEAILVGLEVGGYVVPTLLMTMMTYLGVGFREKTPQ